MSHPIGDLKNQVWEYAGELRRESFILAIDYVAQMDFVANIIETGTYRGENYDGQSTRTLNALAEITGGNCYSIDVKGEHCEIARKQMAKLFKRPEVSIVCSDSVSYLSSFQKWISFLYLDSFDFNEIDFGPPQRHQMAELGAAYGKLADNAIILLDDCAQPHGGKGGISSEFLFDRGWKLVYDKYQRLFIR